jgi:hypothetical protein
VRNLQLVPTNDSQDKQAKEASLDVAGVAK